MIVKTLTRQKGFTLLELLVAMTIAGLIASVAWSVYGSKTQAVPALFGNARTKKVASRVPFVRPSSWVFGLPAACSAISSGIGVLPS